MNPLAWWFVIIIVVLIILAIAGVSIGTILITFVIFSVVLGILWLIMYYLDANERQARTIPVIPVSRPTTVTVISQPRSVNTNPFIQPQTRSVNTNPFIHSTSD